jgi:hypothetical protein
MAWKYAYGIDSQIRYYSDSQWIGEGPEARSRGFELRCMRPQASIFGVSLTLPFGVPQFIILCYSYRVWGEDEDSQGRLTALAKVKRDL